MRVSVRGVAVLGLAILSSGASRVARGDEPSDVPAPVARPTAHTSHEPHGYAEARSPAFEVLAGGATRFSVELSQAASYDTKAGPGRFVCVVKGARAARRNDYNPLVTVNFNTPVASARLMPHGRDLWFVIDLRAAVKPEVKTDAAKDGGMVLQIEFPKGDYAVAAPDAPLGDPPSDGSESDKADSPAPAKGADASARATGSSKRRRGVP